jgi:RpiB/LacA/LacB family sugar-phosphate isomerase
MVANKIKGIRAIMGYSIEAAEKGRSDEDANILCLAGSVLSDEHAGAIVRRFLEMEFENQEKRVRRLKKIEEIEQ